MLIKSPRRVGRVATFSYLSHVKIEICHENIAELAEKLYRNLFTGGRDRQNPDGYRPRSGRTALHAVINFVVVFVLSASFIAYAPDYIKKINEFSFFLARKVYGELPMEKSRELDHFGRVIKRK